MGKTLGGSSIGSCMCFASIDTASDVRGNIPQMLEGFWFIDSLLPVRKPAYVSTALSISKISPKPPVRSNDGKAMNCVDEIASLNDFNSMPLDTCNSRWEWMRAFGRQNKSYFWPSRLDCRRAIHLNCKVLYSFKLRINFITLNFEPILCWEYGLQKRISNIIRLVTHFSAAWKSPETWTPYCTRMITLNREPM